MTTPTSELNRIAVDLDEAELWTLATIVREYAALIKTYADSVAENARLKAAMDKYSENETLGGLRGELLLKRCIEICQEESTDNGTAQKIEARIRALEEKK